jgi:hypothetical protein
MGKRANGEISMSGLDFETFEKLNILLSSLTKENEEIIKTIYFKQKPTGFYIFDPRFKGTKGQGLLVDCFGGEESLIEYWKRPKYGKKISKHYVAVYLYKGKVKSIYTYDFWN